MKIVCVGYLHGAGGAERQIIMLANAMAERNNDVHLIALAAFESKYKIDSNIKIHDLSYIEDKKGNKILNRYKALKAELELINPDISVHYWMQSAYFCAMMSKSVIGNVIYSERGDPGDKEYKGILGLIRKLAFTRIDGFVFQSCGARDYFEDKIKEKSIVIQNSVFLPENKYIEPCKSREKKIVNVGRLHPQKNQKVLIDAFAEVCDKYDDYILEIYGDGPLKKDLQDYINELKLQKKIFLKGTTTNVLDKVYNASLFVLSSDFEGMPNALMEAMAIGVPCISTDCKPGGAREIINNNYDGFITEIGNHKELAKQIDWCLAHKDEVEQMSKKAMINMERFKSQNIFDKWEGFLDKLK